MAQTPAEAFSLKGRVAIVTGAGGGLGHGICDSLAAAGAAVIATGRTQSTLDDTVALVTGNGGNAVARLCDISRQQDIDALMKSVADEFGRIDILINNAAIYSRREWTEITAESWDDVMNTNLKGYFLCARAAFPYMKTQGSGRIVNIASITFFGGWPMLLDYVTSKGGIVGLTLPVAREFAAVGVRCVTIAPGIFDTPLLAALPEEARQALGASIPFPSRLGVPEEYARLACHIAENGMLNGETIRLDGALRMAPR